MKRIFFAVIIALLTMSSANGKIIDNKNAAVQKFEHMSLRELCTFMANYYTENVPIRIDKFVVLIQASAHNSKVQLVKQINPMNEQVKRDYPFMLKDSFLTSTQFMDTVNDVEKKTLCGTTLAPIIFNKGGTFQVQYMDGDRKTLFDIVVDKDSCK